MECFHSYRYCIEIYCVDRSKVTGSIVYDGIMAVVIFSLINIAVCEMRVRSYRRYQAKLDAQENEEDEEEFDHEA